ncbi:MAG: CYTH domain-containing protein [Muribaculaceae bacterium]|nr:CYTH domain-containing protein [Muribaculaceae bacterium]
MGLEIERKFLVKNDSFKDIAISHSNIRQGYLSREPERTVRIRIKDDRGFITVKGKNSGAVRLEFEYEIPFADAEKMLGLCSGKILDKTRYNVKFGGYLWEIDVFHGLDEQLTVAEIELPSADASFEIPDFIGEEVTGNPRYYNSML